MQDRHTAAKKVVISHIMQVVLPHINQSRSFLILTLDLMIKSYFVHMDVNRSIDRRNKIGYSLLISQ